MFNFQILLPAAFVCMAMAFTLILPPLVEEPQLEIDTGIYPGKVMANIFRNENYPVTVNLSFNPHNSGSIYVFITILCYFVHFCFLKLFSFVRFRIYFVSFLCTIQLLIKCFQGGPNYIFYGNEAPGKLSGDWWNRYEEELAASEDGFGTSCVGENKDKVNILKCRSERCTQMKKTNFPLPRAINIL